jgi:phage baseplate assembly protein W
MGDRWHGLVFPFKRGPQGWFSDGSDDDLISSSIQFIIGICLNDYICLPDFGANVCPLIFEPNDDVLSVLLRSRINEALSRWEPRISVQTINTLINDDQVNVTISYVFVSEPGTIRFFNDSFQRLTA